MTATLQAPPVCRWCGSASCFAGTVAMCTKRADAIEGIREVFVGILPQVGQMGNLARRMVDTGRTVVNEGEVPPWMVMSHRMCRDCGATSNRPDGNWEDDNRPCHHRRVKTFYIMDGAAYESS